MKIKHLLIVIIAFANPHTKANIWLVNDSLKSIYIGSPASTDRNLGINMRQINGIYWRYNNKFLQLDISAAHPRLAGTNDTIYFCDLGTNYNTIAVKRTEYLSERSKKRNIKAIETGLDIIDKLVPINNANTSKKTESKAVNLTSTLKGMDCPASLDIENLKHYIPEAVVNLDDGQKGLNYTAILPFLTKAMQELKNTIEQQQNEVDSLQTLIEAQKSKLEKHALSAEKSDNRITISYKLPKDAKTAYLQLCDEKGQQLRIINISGTNSTSIHSDELPNGKGFHAIVVEGNIIEASSITTSPKSI